MFERHLRHAMIPVVAVYLVSLSSMGQEPAKKTPPRGRLPAHYKDLVSPEQREEIYAIQGKFNSRIDTLEAEIEKLKKERDAQVERVLTPQQLQRLRLLQGAKGKAAEPNQDQPAPAANGNAEKGDQGVFPK